MCHSSQRRSGPKVKRFVSYDIACQWYKKFFIRALNLPDTVRPELLRSMWQFVVPKLHIRGHIRFCQMNFSFHLLLGVGNTDGEGIERHWASLGPVGTSTREMGPGNRRDTLDDHLGAWNWYKTITMGMFWSALPRYLPHMCFYRLCIVEEVLGRCSECGDANKGIRAVHGVSGASC